MVDARRVYVAIVTQYDIIDGEPNFIPCVVVEGKKGYTPMRGQGECSSPWYWGKTYDECQDMCDSYNEEHFGISKREAAIIVASSM